MGQDQGPSMNLILSLPCELRLKIYRLIYLFASPIQVVTIGRRWPRPACHRNITLLLLNKQITSEALSVLYGENTFSISLRGTVFSLLFKLNVHTKTPHAGRIRKLEVLIAGGWPFRWGDDAAVMAWGLWLRQLDNLVVLIQRQSDMGDEDNETREEREEREFSGIFFHIIREIRPEAICVEMDDDPRSWEYRVVKVFLTGR